VIDVDIPDLDELSEEDEDVIIERRRRERVLLIQVSLYMLYIFTNCREREFCIYSRGDVHCSAYINVHGCLNTVQCTLGCARLDKVVPWWLFYFDILTLSIKSIGLLI